MNGLLYIGIISVIASVRGEVVNFQQRVDSEVAGSYPGWTLVEYGGHSAPAAQALVQEAALWKAKEIAHARAIAEQHSSVDVWEAKVTAEKQRKALALQSAAEQNTYAQQEAANALWRAKGIAEEEKRSLLAIHEAELAEKEASLATLAAQSIAEQENKAFLAARARASGEDIVAAEKARLAEELRQKAALISQARALADEEAAAAAQRVHVAKNVFWNAHHAAAH